MPDTTYSDIMGAGQSRKEPILERALKLSYLIKQIENQGLTAQAKKVAIKNAEVDAYQDSVRFLIDVNTEKRKEAKFGMDKKTWEDNQAKIETDAFNDERDEHQENIGLAESLVKGAGIDYAANLKGDDEKYLPKISQQMREVQANASLIIGDVNSIMVNSSINDLDKKKQIEAIKTANPKISSGTLANIEGALGIVDSRIHETVKNRWISRNINHPDAGRIGLLPPTDAYEEILKKDPIKDINALVNRVTRNTSALTDIQMGGLAGVDTEATEKVVTQQIKADTKTLNTLTEVTAGPNPDLMEKAFKGFKERNPKYFTTDAGGNDIIVPEFRHVVEDSVGALYSKMINQP